MYPGHSCPCPQSQVKPLTCSASCRHQQLPAAGTPRSAAPAPAPPRASPRRLIWDRVRTPRARLTSHVSSPRSPGCFPGGACPAHSRIRLPAPTSLPFPASLPRLRAPSRSLVWEPASQHPNYPAAAGRARRSATRAPEAAGRRAGLGALSGWDYVSQEPPRRLAEGFWDRVTAAALD